LRGNVVDLAVGVIIGAAFGAIVSSMVGDVIMPIIGAVTGALDFSNYYLPLSSAVKTGQPLADAKKAGAVLAYGSFITAALNFLISLRPVSRHSRHEQDEEERRGSTGSADAVSD
jgi:large conductance mechanosensitive channel